jgi:hypothetical protein
LNSVELLERLTLIGAAAVRREYPFSANNGCAASIAAAQVATTILREHNIRAQPCPVAVEIEHAPSGTTIRTGQSTAAGGWQGHLIVVAQEYRLIDWSFYRFSNPGIGLLAPNGLQAMLPAEWWNGDWSPCGRIPGGTRVRYRHLPTIESRWRSTVAWGDHERHDRVLECVRVELHSSMHRMAGLSRP